MIFYKPMLAKSISKPFSGKDWIFKTKWDGFGAIAYVKDDLFTIQSRNGNVLIVKQLLRHKCIESSMKYIHPRKFEPKEYEETTATTIEEIRNLGKGGWTKYDEITFNGVQVHFYRRPKRFSGNGNNIYVNS